MKTYVLNIIGVITIILVILFAYRFINKMTSEAEQWRTKYEALYLAKTKTDTIIILDTVVIKSSPEIIRQAIVDSLIVTDTFFLAQPLMDRTYEGRHFFDSGELGYSLLVRGWLLSYEFTPIITSTTLHTQHVVYPEPQVWGAGISAGGGLGVPAGWYLTGGYRINRITYRGIYFRTSQGSNFLIGAEINF